MKLAICGIDCDACKYAAERDCPGCQACEGKMFWGTCDLYACASEKGHAHCGLCAEFPCQTLNEYAAAENPERIDNLRKLRGAIQ